MMYMVLSRVLSGFVATEKAVPDPEVTSRFHMKSLDPAGRNMKTAGSTKAIGSARKLLILEW
jgi:hypothetical protein